MVIQRRFFTSLPAYLQTNRNNLESAVLDDLFYEPEQSEFISGFIGDTSKLSEQDLARTPLLKENKAIRQKYQFSIGVAQIDPNTQNYISGAFYDDLLNHLLLNGAIINDPNRIFSAYYYAWSPPIDYDKIVNPARYFWTGNGNAVLNGEYITKEAAGSQTKIHQFNGFSLIANSVTIVNGLPISGTTGQIVEDVSSNDRLLYKWNGSSWDLINFIIAADINVNSSYFSGDYVYVCRTGSNFNRPVVWVYRPKIGRWISLPVVISITAPETAVLGTIWEDATSPPKRRLRIFDGAQWLLLQTGTIDPYTNEPITYVKAAGPSGNPSNVTYLFDTRGLDAVDSWSAQNWWRSLSDLSLSDQGALKTNSQGTRPIIEFWGNLESAVGDVRTYRNQFPKFNLYAVSPVDFEIKQINSSNFVGLDILPLTQTGNFIGGSVVSTIFNYETTTGISDSVLGFAYKFGKDGTPLFELNLERLPITINNSPILGYRYFKDTSTGYVNSIWSRTNKLLLQNIDENGLYDVPKNLKFNPDHIVTTELSRSNYINHFASVIKSQINFSGTPYGSNNFRYTPKDLTSGATMIDPEESLQRVMTVLQTNKIDLPDAIRQMSREYNKVMVRFINQLNTYWNDGTISDPTDTLKFTVTQTTDAVLTQIFIGRNNEFPFYNSSMGTFVETRIVSGILDIFDTTPIPIFIPNSAAHIGSSPTFKPEIFTDVDGILKIRGHDGSLIHAYKDARDDVILNLENRFFDAISSYMKTENTSFSGRFSSIFHLDDYYGNLIPNITAGTVVDIVNDYNSIVSPITGDRHYSILQQVFATWDGTRWLTRNISTNDVFFNQSDEKYYIFNGFFAKSIETFNNPFTFDYSENEYRSVIQREFERWVVLHNYDFITNNDFDINDPFTWNFSSAGIEGNWRGIYRRIYNTIRPHTHPWEVVGYSVRPDWWFTSYVPTSYAVDGTPRYSNVHIMWSDFQAGIVNPISGKQLNQFLMVAPIPVDINGELLDPIAAGIVNESDLSPSSLGDDWAYGDGSPIEQLFYDSYYYPFAVSLAGYLMKTTLFVDRTWSEFYRQIGLNGSNILWNAPHTVYNATLTRPAQSDVASHLSIDSSGNIIKNPGLNSWIAEYTNIIGLSANLDFDQAIKNSNAVLGWKTSGFINQKRTIIKLLSGDEIPNEDINVILHQGPSINEYFQSGIIIVRDVDGFRVFGTDVLNPYFTVDIGAKPISGGQIETTESFTYDGSKIHPLNDSSISYDRSSIKLTDISIPPFTNDTASFSVLINGYRINKKFIQRIDSTHFSIDRVLMLNAGDRITVSVITTVSNPSTQLGSFTINNVQVTYFATGTGNLVNYPYGTLFETLSDVVNMMIGYGRYLSSQGWIFERLTNGILRDWLGAAKTFVKWSTDLTIATRGNPMLMKGKIFQYSVMGRQAKFSADFGMILGIEDIRNGSYGVVDVNGIPIRSKNLNVVKSGGSVNVSSDTTDIFGLRLYLSEVQHVVFFPNTTTFGDILYEPAFGLSQDALYVDTYRTTNWNGRMEAPGFLINDGNLYPSWEKITNDITRYYDRFNPPDDPILVGMARALYGYSPKTYLNELASDDRNQFNFYRGTLKTKGTFQPYKAYVRGTTSDNVSIFEDWAWKFAVYGDQRSVTVLFNVNAEDFVDVFQAIRFDNLAFSLTFVGDETTTCFVIPERFTPNDVVVIVDDVLQVLNIDYTMAANDSGYNMCFFDAPLRDSNIIVSLNDNLSHAKQDTFFVPSTSAPTKTFHDSIRAKNIIFGINGNLAIAGTDYFVSNNTLSYLPSGATVYGIAFFNLGEDFFVQRTYFGDNFTSLFDTSVSGQSTDTVIVAVNGILRRPIIDYIIDNISNPGHSLVSTLAGVVNLNDRIDIISVKNPKLCRTKFTTFVGNGIQTFFSVSGISIDSYRKVLVSVQGIIQIGPQPSDSNIPYTYIVNSGGILFNTPPANGAYINVYIFLDVVTEEILPLEDDRVLHIPQFSPPNDDNRWVIPPPQDLYRDKPFRFPLSSEGVVDVVKYKYTAAIVDQKAKDPAIRLFHWDPARDLHEPLASSFVDYKTPFDPAKYNSGILAGTENDIIWGEQQVGNVWWDTSVLLYSNYERNLPDYMNVTREWGKLKYFKAIITRTDDLVTVTTLDPDTNLATDHNLINGQKVIIYGADQQSYNGIVSVNVSSSSTFTFSIQVAEETPATGNIVVQVGMVNCYEWVASPVPPTAWNAFVESQSGFDTYTGTVFNSDNPSYSTSEIWDVNGNETITYYFWVQSNTRLIPKKGISVNDIAGRLKNPSQYQIPFFGIIDEATMFVFTGDDIVLDNSGIEIKYYWNELPKHIEWLLISQNDSFRSLPALVTDKLLDSMLGTDSHGNAVPNPTLSPSNIYGTAFFPAQTVFQNKTNAINIYCNIINSIVENIDINTVFTLFSRLNVSDIKTNSNPNGYWEKSTWWLDGIDHSIIYDTVISPTELTFFASHFYYNTGDIVKVIQSNEVDPWDFSQVASYYQYNGTSFTLVGIDNHTFIINPNILLNKNNFRGFFDDFVASVTRLQANKVIFSLLLEMIKQNPNCDWFFKTSYIDVYVTQDIPITPYVYPDQTTLIINAIKDLKPFRTKLRDELLSIVAPKEDINVTINENEVDKITLVFDRVACDLTDENSWDTIPWDATVTYPETQVITIPFVGNGIQTCFIIPEIVPSEDIFVFINNRLATKNLDYKVDVRGSSICFTQAPILGTSISVVIDGPYEYFAAYEYSFKGNGIKNLQTLPDSVSDTVNDNVFTSWNGVQQKSSTDFNVVITSETDVLYVETPTSEIQVKGTVFGGVLGDIFVESNYLGNGSTTSFSTNSENQTIDSVVVVIDGVWQAPNIDYTIDNITSAPTSLIKFVSPPNPSTIISIHALANPGWVNSASFVFIGNGSQKTFVISNLDAEIPPIVFVNVDGIQQNYNTGDYIIGSSGVTFANAPVNGAVIAIFVVWSGIGERLIGNSITYPQTIQWDWAFWNYADLGRKEFDFAGFFLGNDITDSFTIPIPQTSTLLYNTILRFFQNGVEVSINDLGLTYSQTKLTTGIVIFFSSALPSNVYGALYISRGFTEGLEPTFGYQDPSGIVFQPVPSSYQHYFARLISPNYDPSSIMDGCPNHTPEERIQSIVDDLFTIVVFTGIQEAPVFQTANLIGLSVAAEIGEFAFFIDTNPFLAGVAAIANTGTISIGLIPPPFDLSGVESISQYGDLITDVEPSGSLETIAEIGDFAFFIDTNPSVSGVEATALFHDILKVLNVNPLETNAEIGILIPKIDIAYTGQESIAQFGSFTLHIDTNPSLSGRFVTAHFGTIRIQRNLGVAVISQIGNLNPNISAFVSGGTGLESQASAGILYPSPKNVFVSGLGAAAQVGSVSVSSGF
jgi:hypothetical protein